MQLIGEEMELSYILERMCPILLLVKVGRGQITILEEKTVRDMGQTGFNLKIDILTNDL
jgi:hypothetical protein